MRPIHSSKDVFKFLLAIIDHFSKIAEVIPVYTKDMHTIVHLVDTKIIQKFGNPKTILTENVREFKNKLSEEFAKKLRFVLKFGFPYKPTTTGLVERYNKTLLTKLRMISEFKRND